MECVYIVMCGNEVDGLFCDRFGALLSAWASSIRDRVGTRYRIVEWDMQSNTPLFEERLDAYAVSARHGFDEAALNALVSRLESGELPEELCGAPDGG